jgi:galactitol-specific phosphotransferase system IIB component
MIEEADISLNSLSDEAFTIKIDDGSSDLYERRGLEYSFDNSRYKIIPDNTIDELLAEISNADSNLLSLSKREPSDISESRLSQIRVYSGFFSDFNSINSKSSDYELSAIIPRESPNADSDTKSTARYVYEKAPMGNNQLRTTQNSRDYHPGSSSIHSNAEYDIFETGILKEEPKIGSDTDSKLSYLYEKAVSDEYTKAPRVEEISQFYGSFRSIDTSNSNLLDDNDKQDSAVKMANDVIDVGSSLDYVHKNLAESARPSADQSIIDANDIIPYLYSKAIESQDQSDITDISNADYIDLEKYNKISSFSPISSYKNYAIIIGINNYSDRRSLSNCVNDANAIADILTSCGYEVIKLTDDTVDKPTKNNILNKTLTEIGRKKDQGKVLFYFSGHSEIDQNGNSYLIPQDANGNSSSFISEKELESYISNLNQAAIIIDACNSGGFGDIINKDDVIIASSKENEASNEDWFNSYSVFTKNLLTAIKEEKATSNKIILQSCFDEAKANTIQWSKTHLRSQTPILFNPSDRDYYLN